MSPRINALRRRVLVLLVLGLVASPAAAEPLDEGAAVAALLAAAGEGDAAQPPAGTLARLAADPAHDPWLLAEHLLAHDRADLALLLAGHADVETLGPLPSYVRAPGAAVGGSERARALTAAERALEAGDHEAARRLLERVRAVRGRLSVFGVQAVGLLGDALAAEGQSSESIEAWIAGGEEALRIGWWGRADDLFTQAMGTALREQSLDLLARGAEGMRALREVYGDRLYLAGAVQNLGSIAHWRGDLPSALRHLNEASSLFEALDAADDVADVRSQRSWILAQTGDFRRALEEQRVLAAHYATRPRDALWSANQVHLGLIRYSLGDEAGAVEALTGALASYRAQGDAGGEAYALGNLALTHLMGGRPREAITAWRAARELAVATQDATTAATASSNIATALRRLAQADLAAAARAEDPGERAALEKRARDAFAEGRALTSAARATAEEVGVVNLACIADHTRAEILLAEGHVDEAVRILQSSRARARGLRAWRSEMGMTVTLARAYRLQGAWDAALREVRTATDALRDALGRLADADMARARSHVSDVYDIGVSAAFEVGREEDLLHYLEAGRAAALLRGLGGRAAALQATVPEALALRLEEATAAKLRAFADWHAYRKGNLREARTFRKRYEALRIAEQDVLTETTEAQAEAATQLAPSRLVAISDLQRRMRGMARPGLHQVFALFNFQRDEATALLVEERKVRVVRYPTASLVPLRDAFATLSAARKGDLDPDALAVVKRLLIDPLEIPAGPTRLFVSPDRDLAYIPLAVILPDEWQIVWEPSATIFDLLGERRLRRGQGTLGLGDPDYRTAADPDVLATRGGARLTPLPATRLEIEAVAGAPGDVRLLAGRATERGLRSVLEARRPERSWESVHFACHGLVDLELPALSCLAITPGDGEDGLLSAGEVLRLPLRADLAVLSACQTGRGVFVRGEGVMSLTRAFMYAGASRVIVSLWDVDDEATSFLMRTFYRHWREGRGTAEALRMAQSAVRDHEVVTTVDEPGAPAVERRHRPWVDPRFWAAWVLWGLPD